uniref:GTPase Era, mitochondrial n=1 Tax=Meloidogyne incognita TaxID=6306 RepID=A0A914KG14_MELIC
MSIFNQNFRIIFQSKYQRRLFCSIPTLNKINLNLFSTTSTEIKLEESSVNVSTPTVGKGLRVAIIGCSNVGKSALTNSLIRSPICAVSKLVDTTRANTTAALTENQCQLIIVDSPGLVSLSHAKEVIGTHSDDRILTHPEKAIERAEQIIVVHDATAKGQYLQHRILYILQRYMHIPACLVINKIDLIESRADLLKLTEILTDGTVGGEKLEKKPISLGIVGSIISKAKKSKGSNNNESLSLHPLTTKERDSNWYSLYNKLLHKPLHKASWSDTKKLFKEQNGWPHFKAVFFTSAQTNEGIDILREYLRENSVDKQWSFAPQTVSKKNSRLLCAEYVRSALLNNCPPHVAYKLRVSITEWEFDEDLPVNEQMLKVAANIFCENEREARQVWYRMEEIENAVLQQLQQVFCQNAIFRLFIRVKDRSGIYQPDEKAEEKKKIMKTEEKRKLM